MDADKAARELQVIRELMQRPVRYSTMSGLSGILAGLAALTGVLADRVVSGRLAHDPLQAVKINMGVWAGVFLLAFTAAVLLTRIRERRQGMPFWSDIKKRILLTILPPFVAGVGLTLVVVYRVWAQGGSTTWGLIPAIWMLFYGVALWQVGLYSPVEVRVLGAAFILAGLLAGALLHGCPYLALGATFGGFHILYGIVVWFRHGG
jgi:hypothetical protein